ncbi:MAG: alpha-L-fucosidase [Mobilitalea sp.]
MDKAAYLKEIDQVIESGPFKDNWDSLAAFEVPLWYKNAKFGIFIHWGVYSVPAYKNEWYSRNMYIQGTTEYEHHIKTYGAHKDFGYKDFIPMFKAEKFDAAEWADLFEKAGAKYVVPVAEHHDGFQMYRSDISHYNAYEMGPKKDTLGALKQEFDKRGIELGTSSHRVEHWFFMSHGKEFESDIKEPLKCGDFYWPSMEEPNHHDLYSTPAPSIEYLEDWLIRTCEIVDKYKPKLMYFDWWIQHSAVKPYLKKFAAYYYNKANEWGIQVAIDYKHDAFAFGTAVVDIERGQFADIKPFFWQTDTAVARNSWCYTEDNHYKTANEIIKMMIDVVSKNGSLLLNIGPKADGTIPEEDKNILLKIGEWMAVNGEAIYDTHPYRVSGEGPTTVEEGQFSDGKETMYTSEDIRFTMKGSNLYAIVMVSPKDGKVNITTLGKQDSSIKANFNGIIKVVELLGSKQTVKWEREEEALHLSIDPVEVDMPIVFKINLD